MDWVTSMNAAVSYIEARLDGEIDLAELGRIAGCSAYHFQRVFGYMANTTLAEYIRRRRLTRAAFDLQSGGEKVLDTALRYGYDSPTSFARAFQQMHGIAPSQAKSNGSGFVSYPPISFQISILGGSAMNYRIEQKEAFRIVGKKIRTTMEEDKGLKEIPEFWGRIHREGLLAQICPLMDTEPAGVLGVCAGSWENQSAFDYYVGVATTQATPEGMVEYEVPVATWAMFECVGPMPQAIQQLQKRIVAEWLPASGYNYGEAPDIEIYGEGDQGSPNYKSWVWMPVVKK